MTTQPERDPTTWPAWLVRPVLIDMEQKWWIIRSVQ
jgi:hypothetical protein